jgi:hypothetical protein
VAVAVAVVDVADDAVGVEDVLEEVVVVVVVVEDVADEAEALQQQVVSIRRMRYSSSLSHEQEQCRTGRTSSFAPRPDSHQDRHLKQHQLPLTLQVQQAAHT